VGAMLCIGGGPCQRLLPVARRAAFGLVRRHGRIAFLTFLSELYPW